MQRLSSPLKILWMMHNCEHRVYIIKTNYLSWTPHVKTLYTSVDSPPLLLSNVYISLHVCMHACMYNMNSGWLCGMQSVICAPSSLNNIDLTTQDLLHQQQFGWKNWSWIKIWLPAHCFLNAFRCNQKRINAIQAHNLSLAVFFCKEFCIKFLVVILALRLIRLPEEQTHLCHFPVVFSSSQVENNKFIKSFSGK